MGWWPAGLLLVAGVVGARQEPRRLRIGVALLGAAVLGAGELLIQFLRLLAAFGEDLATLALLAVLVLLGGMVLVLAVVLVLNGLTMVRKEGRRPANLLSLLLGLLMAGYVSAVVASLRLEALQAWLLLVMLGLPLAYLAFGLLAYVGYAWLYLRQTASRPRPVVAVVVLGTGLIDGRVTPLLASRLNKGAEVVAAARSVGSTPVVVTSGGQGPDEPVAEAVAMAGYLRELLPADQPVLVEDRSRTTAENLEFTAELLTAAGVSGEVAVVTNDYHAFRAALLMRRLGMAGFAIGSPTAGYFWPSAILREYLAVLRDHLATTLVLGFASALPLAGGLVLAVFSGSG